MSDEKIPVVAEIIGCNEGLREGLEARKMRGNQISIQNGDELVRRKDVENIANQTEFFLNAIITAIKEGAKNEDIMDELENARAKNKELLERIHSGLESEQKGGSESE